MIVDINGALGIKPIGMVIVYADIDIANQELFSDVSTQNRNVRF